MAKYKVFLESPTPYGSTRFWLSEECEALGKEFSIWRGYDKQGKNFISYEVSREDASGAKELLKEKGYISTPDYHWMEE
jgi:hypothetical protein